MPHTILDATKIADLSEIREGPPPPTFAPPAAATAQAPVHAAPVPQAQLVDPAIMSVGRRPLSGTPSGSARQVAQEAPAVEAPDAPLLTSEPVQAKEVLAESMNHLDIGNVAHELDSGVAESVPETQKKKSKRRTRQKGSKPTPATEENAALDSPSAMSGRGKGWRQTPMLQSTPSFQPFNSLKRIAKKGTMENGWASEDVTEEMGDFDFENNLAKFDKRTIFEEMRKEDQVDEDSRLVSHNRRVKPGTAGGKNLAYDENVLDIPTLPAGKNADFWNSEADDALNGAERPSGREFRGVSGARRADSKSGLARRSQSRKASATTLAQASQPLSRVNSSVRRVIPS